MMKYAAEEIGVMRIGGSAMREELPNRARVIHCLGGFFVFFLR